MHTALDQLIQAHILTTIINIKSLEFIESEKDLDIILDNNYLKFSSHIINQINKAN